MFSHTGEGEASLRIHFFSRCSRKMNAVAYRAQNVLCPAPVSFSILIADDDAGICEFVEAVLAREGYQTTVVNDGNQAILSVRNKPFDLIILDLFMPRKAGFQTISALRLQTRAKIIAMSGGGRFPTGDSLLIASRLGAHATLAKPFNASQLLDVVRDLLLDNRTEADAA